METAGLLLDCRTCLRRFTHLYRDSRFRGTGTGSDEGLDFCYLRRQSPEAGRVNVSGNTEPLSAAHAAVIVDDAELLEWARDSR